VSVRLAVVGGGVSGLTAAYRLRRSYGADALIDLYEADRQVGGLLATRDVAGVPMDVGAEAFIVRRPEATALLAELGLADEVVSPGPLRPAIWSGGRLHALPSPAVMGIPAGPEALGALLDDDQRELIAGESGRSLYWRTGADPSVGALVTERFGAAVTARSVDPMLGGVYSARADDLGLREAVPALAAALDAGAPSLTAAVASLTAAQSAAAGPVFGALRGGYRRLVQVLERAGGAQVRRGCEVTGLARTGTGYTLVTADGTAADYAGVVLALPAWYAGPLLAETAPQAAAAFAAVAPAGSAVVAVALADGSAVPEHSGVLVASDAQDLRCKAVTLSSQKWPHLAGGPALLRVSFGRLGASVRGTDAELIAAATEDLAVIFAAAGLPAPQVAGALVQRWPTGLPHYGPGHLAAMDRALTQLPPGLAVAGAALSGVGVPACIGAAGRAAERIAADVPAR